MPPVSRLGEVAPGQVADFYALLTERTRGTTRDGKPYYSCRFRGAGRSVGFMAWADGGWFEACENDWEPGCFYKIRARYGEHERYGPQIEVQNLRPVTAADREDGFDPADFVERSRFDGRAMFTELVGLVRAHIADEPLRRLVLTILERHAKPLQRLPATTRHFYPFHGGLLEHVLSVTHTCIQLAEKYAGRYPALHPPVNRDLVVAGAVLHDIGRVLEFDDEQPTVQRTVPGKLLGPLFLGRDLVRDTAREQGDVNPELLQMLEHIVVAHLNLLEKDSPRLPMVPECLIVHHADALDAYMDMYARCLGRDQEPGPFTTRDAVLGRELFKGRHL